MRFRLLCSNDLTTKLEVYKPSLLPSLVPQLEGYKGFKDTRTPRVAVIPSRVIYYIFPKYLLILKLEKVETVVKRRGFLSCS